MMLAPTVWLAHGMQAAQFKRAASDRAAWCAAHPEQDAGPEMCYLLRSH